MKIILGTNNLIKPVKYNYSRVSIDDDDANLVFISTHIYIPDILKRYIVTGTKLLVTGFSTD